MIQTYAFTDYPIPRHPPGWPRDRVPLFDAWLPYWPDPIRLYLN